MASRKNNRTDRDVNRVRNLIIIACALVVGAVVGYGVLYSTGTTDKLSGDGYVEGTHYDPIEGAEPRRPGSPVTITEYFSWGCIHCKNFDPLVKEFKPTLPTGIEFEQVPVTFNPSWALLAQGYLALESIDGLTSNNQRMFKAIHDSRRQFVSAEAIADFVDGKDGVSRDDFLTAFNSAAVRRKLSRIDATSRNLGIASVPALLVDDRYRINMSVGRKQSLNVALFLAEKIRADEGAAN